MTIKTGRIIKNYNGYYYVETEDKELHTCKVKGKLKKERFSLVTGDFVEFEVGGSEGMITQVLPRKNFLQRPSVANVDLAVVEFAAMHPDFNYLLLDKLLALVEDARIPAVIVLNKIDLVPRSFVDEVIKLYAKVGYDVYPTVAFGGIGIEPLRQKVEGKITVFAGPSGVGKSTLLNAIDPNLDLQTGRVSDKIGRGRHTTRFAQLLPFAGGYIVDTPGFSNINLEELPIEDLGAAFREFGEYAQGCRFNTCTHSHEPGCAVKAAVEEGKITEERYASYLKMLEENQKNKERKNWK